MKEIQLTQGKVALIDDEDFDRVNQYKWCAALTRKRWYAVRNASKKEGKQKTILMHQFIIAGHYRLDHKDGNGLNNQKSNLRPATPGQNMANSRKITDCSSRYKGVTWHKRNFVWVSRIRVCGKLIFLGCFNSEVEAAKAYDAAAKIHFKEFARPNFP